MHARLNSPSHLTLNTPLIQVRRGPPEAVNEKAQSETVFEQVYQRLLDVACKRGLAGTQALSPASLARSLGVSRTPVSLALARLEGEGLIRRVEGKGWVLPPIGLNDIEEIFEMKKVLEPLTARLAARQPTAEKAAALLAIVTEMEGASQAEDLDLWLDSDRRFHQQLFSMARNSRLAHYQTLLNYQLGRLWLAYSSMKGHMVKSCREHRRVAEAVAVGDADQAAQFAHEHVTSLYGSLVEVMENVLIPFLSEEV
jgi:DNA-binding GntR family transcriptional regulator